MPVSGLPKALRSSFPRRAGRDASCTGTASHVLSTKVREIAAMLKAIHAGEDIVAARELRDSRLIGAAELVEAAVEETLTYYGFPEEHWRRIRTNNPLERILREIRRRTRVVGAFKVTRYDRRTAYYSPPPRAFARARSRRGHDATPPSASP